MASIDNRNGQSIVQNFNSEINETLNRFARNTTSLRQSKEQREHILSKIDETQANIDAIEQQLKDALLGKLSLSEQEEKQKEKELSILKQDLERRNKRLNQIINSIDKYEAVVQSTRQEIDRFEESSGLVFDALERQLTGDSDLTSLKKLTDTIDLLSLKRKDLEASILEIQSALTDEDLSESSKLELKETLKEKQKELIENMFDINIQQNNLNRVTGLSANNTESVLEELVGRQTAGILNSLNRLWQRGGYVSEMRPEMRPENTRTFEDMALDFAEALTPEFAPITEGIKAVRGVLDVISSVVSTMNNKMGQYIDSAAAAIKSYYGTINANLYGYSNYQTMADQADILGGSTLVRQTDYLSQIASLSADGVARDIEAAAILQTIKDRTLTQFNSSNEALRRLVRLGQDQVYQSQFGLELQLKKVLNSTFKDSGYLSGLFDSVRDTIMDAAVNQTGDITAFNSTVQTWLGAMYSSGLSSNVVNQIANGINALGSGNVSALAGDEATQRLFLLAMDRVGLDYADILQQGLSLNDTNTLLQSVVQYLGEIAGNTSDNLVLKSSYANLFNLTTTDLKAIQNLNQSMPAISSMIVDTSNAVTMTQYAASSMLEANTSVAEKWDNFFDNFQYAIGSNVAESNALYGTWRTASLINNLVSPITNNQTLSKVPVLGTAAKAAQIASGLTQFGIGVESLISAIPEAAGAITEGQGSAVASLLNLSGANASSTLSSSTSPYSRTALKSSSMFTKMSASVDTAAQQAAEYQEETNTGKILEEIEKALREQDGHNAFAVYLEGMTDKTLMSFASIFADEDAMLQTFKGKNNTLEDNLFTYLDDNSKNKNSNTKQA